ncbi:ATP-dependent lipid A-core flippase [uncultured Gammaproteobacteria bacterium]
MSSILSRPNRRPQPRHHTRSGRLIKRLVVNYLYPHRWQLAIALVFMALTAATTGAMAKLIQPVMDDIFQQRDRSLVLPIAGATFGVFLIRGVADYVHSVMMNKIGQQIVAELQKQLYAHLLEADLAYFHATSAGHLISRMVNDVTVMRGAVAECLTSIGKSTMTLLFLVGVMFYQDWALATGAFTAFPIAGWFVASMGKRMRRVSASTQAELGYFTTVLNQTFQGMRHVKAYGMEPYERQRVGQIIDQLYYLVHKSVKLANSTSPVTEVLSGLAIVAVIIYGGFRVIDGNSTVGELMSFIAAFLFAYEPMKRLSKLNAQLQTGLAAADRMFEVLDTHPTILDKPDAQPLVVENFAIRFEKVMFSYPDGTFALRGIDIEVPAGRTVALVGPSGSGKSTLLNLIPRFYDPGAGAVTIGGSNVRDVTMTSLRAQIALVSQEVVLFDDTVRANIAYGRIDASEDDIIAAARAAAAHDFIRALPEGYETLVGEHGVKLSGGQRQRIAIARAMLRDAPILLLDEATSSLDTESERAVQNALRTLQRGRTTLVVAHRLSTVAEADWIYVLDHGLVAESGTHSELLAKGDIYSRLYGLQGSGPEPERVAEPEAAAKA